MSKPPVCLLFIAVVLVGFLNAVVSAETGADDEIRLSKKHHAVFKAYCYQCHDSSNKEGGVDLEGLSYSVAEDNKTAEEWQKVLNVVNSGEMPPADSKPIPDKYKTRLLSDLSEIMVDARQKLSDTGDVITIRRLNRREYANTIEGLLGVRPDVSTLPDDMEVSGFDTSGASLFMSSDQLQQYIKVARKAIDLSTQLTTKKPASKVQRAEAEKSLTFYKKEYESFKKKHARFLKYKAQSDKPAKEFGFVDEYGAKVAMRQHKESFHQLEFLLKRPESKTGAALIYYPRVRGSRITVYSEVLKDKTGGKYKLRVRTGSYKTPGGLGDYLVYGFRDSDSGRSRVLGQRKVTAKVQRPEVIEIEVRQPVGVTGSFFVKQRDYSARNSRWWTNKKYMDETGKGRPVHLWVDYVETEGPYHDQWPLPGTKLRLNKKLRLTPRNVSSLLWEFADKAFRGKKPNVDQIKMLAKRFRVHIKAGVSSQAAINDAYSVLLASPSFLYMSEPGRDPQGAVLPSNELANRLAYFLWSQPPDEQLLDRLKNSQDVSKTLAEEAERMLDDPRSNAFISGFCHQWLDMQRVSMFRYSAKTTPRFDGTVRSSARSEIYKTVRHVIDNRLPLSTLLKADFVVINDVLADYYGFKNVVGHEFRKVPVGKKPRGGFLGMAAVHIMGADGIRASPVERGVWVLRHLLDDPPPPAPANVPQLSRSDTKPRSIRDLQQKHVEAPQCAQCHRKIDPLGYAMHFFDAGGLWREKEVIRKYNGTSTKPAKETVFEINAVGQLSDGSKFRNFGQFRSAVAKKEPDFRRGFVKAMIAYGLGRPISFSDSGFIEDIAVTESAKSPTITELISKFVTTQKFQTK